MHVNISFPLMAQVDTESIDLAVLFLYFVAKGNPLHYKANINAHSRVLTLSSTV